MSESVTDEVVRFLAEDNESRVRSNRRIVRDLVDAAYDTGYYSGKCEDGQSHHVEAIERREKLRDRVLRLLGGESNE